jgi:hypothetical protein
MEREDYRNLEKTNSEVALTMFNLMELLELNMISVQALIDAGEERAFKKQAYAKK